jgi:hypothetical protein
MGWSRESRRADASLVDVAVGSPASMSTIFALLTVAMTWPLAAHLTTHLPVGSYDLSQNLWNFWWWRKALVELGQSPYWTQYLFHPHGTSIVFHTHSEINQLATLPINVAWGPVAAYNAALLVGFPLAGLAAYLLARELSGDPRAAVLAGLIFAFFPHHMKQSAAHTNLATIQFLPLVCLFLVRLVRNGGIRNALLLGVFFALNALGSWHYALFAVLLLPMLLAFELWSRNAAAVPLRRVAGGLALGALVATLLTSPSLWPMLRGIAEGQDYVKELAEGTGIDPVFLFLPPRGHVVWGDFTDPFYRTFRVSGRGSHSSYVGIAPLILMLCAVPSAVRDRRLLSWFTVAGVFLVLALGGWLRFAGHRFDITLPHALFASIPLLATLRTGHRFLSLAMLAIAVLAALGAARLCAGGRRRWLVPLAAGLILVDYFPPSYKVRPFQLPAYLEELAKNSGSGAVLDIPFCDKPRCAENQARQVVHGRPIAGGYLSAGRAAAVAATLEDPGLAKLMGLRPSVPTAADLEHLQRIGFGTVILHGRSEAGNRADHRRGRVQGVPVATLDAIAATLEAHVGPPAYQDDATRVFHLR